MKQEIILASEVDSTLTVQEWYQAMVEDCKNILVEGEFAARWIYIQTYWQLGQRICQEFDVEDRAAVYGKKIVQRVGQSLGKKKQTIYNAVAFYRKYPDPDEWPFDKSISWRRICRKYLPEPKPPEVIDHVPLDSVRLICGDFAEVAQDLQADSFDAIITDPPYPKEYLHLYGLLAKEAARLLKPGGSLLAMAGQSYLPDVFNLMTPHLAYQWTLSYLTPGGQSPQIWPRKINAFWKPVLWFVKGDYAGNWHGDVFKSDVNDNDKRFHHWGQSESGIARLVESFTRPGDVVLDPFVGGGTTAVVCHNLGRRFVGIDIDAEQVAITRRRLTRSVEHGSEARANTLA